MVHTQSSTEASEALLRCGKSTFVAVDAEHLQVWPAIEQLLGVTTTTQGPMPPIYRRPIDPTQITAQPVPMPR